MRLGRLAQLVERLLYTQDVGGSIPSPPTNFAMRRKPLNGSGAAIAAASAPVAGGSTRSDRFLQLLGGTEGDLLARLDLDRLTGGRVAAHARRAVAHLQDTEADKTDAVALLQVLHGPLHQVAENRLSLLLGQIVTLRELSGEMLQGDRRRRFGCHGFATPRNERLAFKRDYSRIWHMRFVAPLAIGHERESTNLCPTFGPNLDLEGAGP